MTRTLLIFFATAALTLALPSSATACDRVGPQPRCEPGSCPQAFRYAPCCACGLTRQHSRKACRKERQARIARADATVRLARRALANLKRAIWRAQDRARYTGSRADRRRITRLRGRLPAAEQQVVDKQAEATRLRNEQPDLVACGRRWTERFGCGNPLH